MNLNIKLFLLCPIPEDQKPINQYINLKENIFLNWEILSGKEYASKFRNFFFTIFLIIGIIASDFLASNFLLWFSISLKYTFLVFLILFLVKLIRWQDIFKIFSIVRIFYEEGSWYDGEIWEKPMSLIKNDKLLSTQKIKPVIKRIRQNFFKLTLVTILLFLLT